MQQIFDIKDKRIKELEKLIKESKEKINSAKKWELAGYFLGVACVIGGIVAVCATGGAAAPALGVAITCGSFALTGAISVYKSVKLRLKINEIREKLQDVEAMLEKLKSERDIIAS